MHQVRAPCASVLVHTDKSLAHVQRSALTCLLCGALLPQGRPCARPEHRQWRIHQGAKHHCDRHCKLPAVLVSLLAIRVPA